MFPAQRASERILPLQETAGMQYAPPMPGWAAAVMGTISAKDLRNKIVDQCERLQLQSAGITKNVAEVLQGKNQKQ